MSEDDSTQQELLEEIAIITLDVVGIFDPTGVADIGSGMLSAKRGDWLAVGISAFSLIPVLGDLAKAGKLGRYARTVRKAVRMAMDNPRLRSVLEEALRSLWDLLKRFDPSVLPSGLRAPIQSMKDELGILFGKAANKVSYKVNWRVLEATRTTTDGAVKVLDRMRMQVGNRIWDIGRNSAKAGPDGKSIGSVFKHFGERAGKVPQHSAKAHSTTLEMSMVYALDLFERQWKAGKIISDGDRAGRLAAKGQKVQQRFVGEIRTTIDGWELGVNTASNPWRLFHVNYK